MADSYGTASEQVGLMESSLPSGLNRRRSDAARTRDPPEYDAAPAGIVPDAMGSYSVLGEELVPAADG